MCHVVLRGEKHHTTPMCQRRPWRITLGTQGVYLEQLCTSVMAVVDGGFTPEWTAISQWLKLWLKGRCN